MNDELRTPPNDRHAETMVLGAMMVSPAACGQALSMLVGSDFYRPDHQTIFETIAALYEDRQPTEANAVLTRLQAHGVLAKVGGGNYLVELVGLGQTPSNAAYYATQVADYAQRRALIVAGTRIVQRAFAYGDDTADELTGWAAEQVAAVAAGTGDSLEDDGLDEAALCGEPPAYDWLIPGLLERGDRLILTGSEGMGKSTLTRQLAVQAAAGIHPFTAKRSTGVRVMVVDCENGERTSRRRYNPLLLAARDAGKPVGGRLKVHLETQGLDLTQRSGAGWLLRRVERFKPDLLVIGPLYRLHFGDPNDERDARRVAATLDRAREVGNCGLILEAHSPHKSPAQKTRTLRPVGSSLWMRWPEFGFGIAREESEAGRMFRVSEFSAWRGPRDERSWPRRLRSGGDGPWPWVDDNDQPGWSH
jgi:hypothetical protein